MVRALAKVGLVWALAVLGALFMAMSAQGLHPDGGYSLAATGSPGDHPSISAPGRDGPRTAGLALSLAVLAGGVVVLGAGALGRGRDREPLLRYSSEPHPASTLPLVLGLDLRP